MIYGRQGALIFGVIAAACASPALSQERPDAAQPETAKSVVMIRELTNEFRQENKLEPVTVNETLTKTAQDFADFMASTDKYGHTADGKEPAERASEHGYVYCIVSENIAYRFRSTGFTTEDIGEGFFEGWKNSPEHRENMLTAGVTETGVAIAKSEKSGKYYGVQLFGRPRSASLAFRIANNTGVEVTYTLGDKEFKLPANYARTHEVCLASELAFRPLKKPKQADEGKAVDVQKLTTADDVEYTLTKSGNGALKIAKRAAEIELPNEADTDSGRPGQ